MKRHFCIFMLAFLTVPTALKAQDITRTVSIKGSLHIAHLDTSGFYVYNRKADTILNISAKNFANFEFRDFNSDGYNDIFLDWGGNISNRFSLYLFLPSKNMFREIKEFHRFPDANPIIKTQYYYSYHRAGCADNTWYSDLFYIRDYTTVKVGTIYGEGCGIKDGIYISKVRQGKKVLIKVLPLKRIEEYRDHKWGFIRQYWTENYSKFL